MSGRQATATGFVLFVVAPDYVYEFSNTGWGWIHLVLGALLIIWALPTYRPESHERARTLPSPLVHSTKKP
ncbi:hypothetical protein ABGB12_21410 [Actinocorallia sp. B10E7]